MAKALILGYYGGNNVGDELLADTIADWLVKLGYECCLISIDPTRSAAIHKHRAIYRYDLKALVCEISMSDIFVLGGGGIFQEHYPFGFADLYEFPSGNTAEYAQVCLLAHQFGLPQFFVAQGIGPVRSESAAAVILECFRNAAFISVRDNESAEFLSSLKCSRKITVAPDPIWSRLLPSPGYGNTNDIEPALIGIIVRAWPSDTDWPRNMGQSLATLKTRGIRFRFINFGGTDDGKAILQVAAYMDGATYEIVDVSSRPLDAERDFNGCCAVISMRYHGIICAELLGIQVIAINCDRKIELLAKELSIYDEWCLDLDAELQHYAAMLDRLLLLLSSSQRVRTTAVRNDLVARSLTHRRELVSAIMQFGHNRSPSPFTSQYFDWFRHWMWVQSETIVRLSNENRELRSRLSRLQARR